MHSADVVEAIGAGNDLEALTAWITIHEASSSPETLRVYRREGLRFLRWVAGQGLTLRDLKARHAAEYLKMLASPPPELIGPHRRLRDGEARLPFRKALSATSRNHIRRVLGNWLGFLHNGGYLRMNVFRMTKKTKGGDTNKFSTHAFDREVWQSLFLEVIGMAKDPDIAPFHAARCRWIVCLIVMSGLRRAEAASLKMNSFFYKSKRWWLHVKGKGQKERDISVTPELLEELTAWRTFLDLSPLPAADDATPAIVAKSGIGKPLREVSGGTIYRIIDQVFKNAEENLRAKGMDTAATIVADASVHWLRHTNANFRLEDGQNLRDVRDELGHEDISTTQIYLKKEDVARHTRAQSVRFRPTSAS